MRDNNLKKADIDKAREGMRECIGHMVIFLQDIKTYAGDANNIAAKIKETGDYGTVPALGLVCDKIDEKAKAAVAISKTLSFAQWLLNASMAG